MSIIGLGYIGIGVSDIGAWRRFAGDILGCQIVEGPDGPDGGFFIRIDDRVWRIAIESNASDDIIYAGWEVEGPVQFEAMVERIEQSGTAVKRDRGRLARKRRVMGLAQFTDPGGVPCELFWGGTRVSAPFVSPAGTSGFITGAQGLGHIVVSAADPDAFGNFYKDVLGFRLTDEIVVAIPGSEFKAKLTFLHCNPRHHSMAYLPAPRKRKLHHFMLETRTIDDVGYALHRFEKAGGKLALTLGRHSNDEMISFYAYSPSGFEVEYGWGALMVDDATWVPERHEAISYWGHNFVGGSPVAEAAGDAVAA